MSDRVWAELQVPWLFIWCSFREGWGARRLRAWALEVARPDRKICLSFSPAVTWDKLFLCPNQPFPSPEMLVTAVPISEHSPGPAPRESAVHGGHHHENAIEVPHYRTDAESHRMHRNPQTANLREPDEPVSGCWSCPPHQGTLLWRKKRTVYVALHCLPTLICILPSSLVQGCCPGALRYLSRPNNLIYPSRWRFLQHISSLALIATFHSERERRVGIICQGYGRIRHPTFCNKEDEAFCFAFILQPGIQSGHTLSKRLPKLKSLDLCTF